MPLRRKELIIAALKFLQEIAERGLTVGGKGAMGADILAETVDGKLIAREGNVFQGSLRNLYDKIMTEEGQIENGTSQTDLDRLVTRDVIIQVSDELAKTPGMNERAEKVVRNADDFYKELGQNLRQKLIAPLRNQIGSL